METGSGCGCRGADRGARILDVFIDDEGGYTTVAVAVALLMSIALTFGVAASQWSHARAADVQEVADAAAMSGENCVAAFSTIAQVLDACVLSMGLLGAIVYGAGMIVAAIPVLQQGAPRILEAGRQILECRKKFAKSASQGLERLEKALPALIMANSASTVSANSSGGLSYAGIAVPYPQESKSDFSHLLDEVDGKEMEKAAEDLREASARKKEAIDRANDAKERGWHADNVGTCMRERAQSLAKLTEGQNPMYPSPSTWKFDFARRRAVNYYTARAASNVIDLGSADELQRSCARAVFYRYAAKELSKARCEEGEVVDIQLPELPHTTRMVMETELYSTAVWPCTSEEAGVTLHCSLDCPGATGPFAGNASLADIESGSVAYCETCRMNAAAMGNVADASTNINNGFEHYWRIVVGASRDYQRAKEDERKAEEDMKRAAEKSGSAFEKAMNMLAVERPRLCSPGAYGCIGFVMRDATKLPRGLSSAFLKSGTLPAGVAISGAALAPDDDTDGHNVLASVFDGLERSDRTLFSGLLDGIGDLWGSLLVGYGSAYGSVSQAANKFFEDIGGVFGEKVASWMRRKVKDVVSKAGFEPSDMRLRKPVLTNSQHILDKAGATKTAEVRSFIQSLPHDQRGIIRTCRSKLVSMMGDGGKVTIAEIPIPGMEGASIPLTIDLSTLSEAIP